MNTLFVVKTVDVRYAAMDVKSIGAWTATDVNAPFQSKDIQPMTRVEAGTYQFGPIDAAVFQVFVDHPDFWELNLKLLFKPDPKPEQWEFEKFPTMNARNRTTHTRDGGGLVVEVVLVMSQYKLVDSDVALLRESIANRTQNESIRSNQPSGGEVRSFEDTILTGKGTGEKQFNFTMHSATPDLLKKVRYLQGKVNPKLVVCYDPVLKAQAQKNSAAAISTKINYHVFFHPSTSHFGNDPYPFGELYLDMVTRYVLFQGDTYRGHGMALQHRDINFENVVAVYPVGSARNWHNSMSTQASVLRVLQEMHYWVQRADGDRFPQQPMGGVAISGFSSSIAFVETLLGQRGGPLISKGLWKEVYSFDGHHAGGTATSFCQRMVEFVKEAPDQRAFRAYSQSSEYANVLMKPGLPGAVTTLGKATEAEGASFSILFAPTEFWSFLPVVVADRPLFDHAHQTIPAWFMQHARRRSRM